MILSAPAFLAFWNDSHAGRSEYEHWHSIEHVPERLTVPGILAARRYVGGSGPLPEYFTLYLLSDLAVLSSPAYLRLLDQPTAWSRRMRSDLAQVLRYGCRTAGYAGVGLGSQLAVKLLDLDPAGAARLPDLARRSRCAGVNAVTIGLVDRDAPRLNFGLQEPVRREGGNALLLVEGYYGPAFREALAGIEGELEPLLTEPQPAWTSYELAFAAEQHNEAPAFAEEKDIARATED